MGFKIPEDITALDNEALQKAIDEAAASLENVTVESSDEELEAAEAITQFIEAAGNEVSAREQALHEREERVERIKAAGKKPEAEDDPPADAEAENTPTAEEEAEAVAEAERIAQEAEQQEVAAAAKPIVASAKKPITARAAAKAPAAKVPAPQSSLIAAADVPGFAAGHKFGSLTAAGEAIMNRLQSFPQELVPNMNMRNGAVIIKAPENKYRQDGRDITELLAQVSDDARKRNAASLAAAGGWGAPSEQILSFCAPEGIDGLLTIPEVTLTRPGVSYTRGPSFADVLGSGTGFWDMTEATAEAGVQQKTSLRPSIPTFTEKRPDAVGVMMEAGLLLRAGWPELVERYATLLLLAHQYKMNQKSIAQIQAYTGAATAINTGFNNELDILHVIELVAEGERQRNFLPAGQAMEVLLPAWVRPAMRAGLAQRNGVDTISVTNAQIDGHFAARNVRVQFLRGYQDMPLASGIAVTYPDTVEFIMYPAGTYVRGVLPVITLDTIYDSVNLKKNDYVHLFVEQGVLMTNPCGDGRRISVPFLVNGRRANVSDPNDDLFNTAEA